MSYQDALDAYNKARHQLREEAIKEIQRLMPAHLDQLEFNLSDGEVPRLTLETDGEVLEDDDLWAEIDEVALQMDIVEWDEATSWLETSADYTCLIIRR